MGSIFQFQNDLRSIWFSSYPNGNLIKSLIGQHSRPLSDDWLNYPAVDRPTAHFVGPPISRN